ncbi:Membrane protein involved in the export of O-antigen and teichoic acid [Micromonospora purpureochromogenes]|uniref:Membrane protein involved in the export of O-antigen and teichoic acid n=1 Tax=Micromonospora purpureochromogenes TaxID=47872 RepID=A0A1C4ZK12_9ACTN|nr:hypothetical protein [Micromonospora purpureochromogenes]SCF33262.1 Membrane protein involved in the export of O-antigen and teichoic acid [Micromonospora purpureochromogenes]
MRGQTIFAALSSLLSGVLNAGILAVCARGGQTDELAAYAIMTAALTWVAVLATGGTAMLYATGDERECAAIRSQRVLVVSPLLIVSAVGVSLLYVGRGYGLVALAAAALGTIGNSFTQLQFSDLYRQFRFVAASVVMVGSRLAGLVLVLVGVPLTIALVAATALQLLTAEGLVCRDAATRRGRWRGLTVRSAAAAFRMNGHLMSCSLAEVFTGRSGGIALSMVASPHVVGSYAAVNGVYQALTAVVYQGLRVPMAVRVRHRHGLGAHGSVRESEVMVVVVAALTGVAGWLLAPWLTTAVLGLTVPGMDTTLGLFLLALPFLTVNRAIGLARLGDGNYRAAARLALLTAGLAGLALLVQAPRFGPAGAAAATLASEALTTVVVGALCGHLALRARRRRRMSDRTGPAAPVVERPGSGLPV